MLFSRQLINGSQDFFFIFIYFFKYKTIETHARAFFPLNISAVGSVRGHPTTIWNKFYPIFTPTPLEWTIVDNLHIKVKKGCLDLILSPSPFVKIQIVGVKFAKRDNMVFVNLSTSTYSSWWEERRLPHSIVPAHNLNFHGNVRVTGSNPGNILKSSLFYPPFVTVTKLGHSTAPHSPSSYPHSYWMTPYRTEVRIWTGVFVVLE